MQTDRFIKKVGLSALLVSIVACFGAPGRASEARMGGLGRTPTEASPLAGNPMVEDMTDIVELPGLISAYSNSLFLTVYPEAPFGNAGAIVGDRLVVGGWVNRRPKWNDIDRIDEYFDSFSLPEAYNIMDLFFGAGFGFGVRLSLTAGLDTEDTIGAGAGASLQSNGESVFGFEVAPGYSMDLGAYRGDFGAGLSFSYFQVAVGGAPAYSASWAPSFFIRHRSTIGEREALTNWVLDVLFTRRSYGVRSEGDDPESAMLGHWLGSFVVGPKFNMPRDFTIWGGLSMEIEHLSGEVAGDQQPKLTAIGTPGVVLSGELLLFDMLAVRAGIEYVVYWGISSEPDVGDLDFDGDDEEIIARERDMGQRFAWSSGLGITLGDFQIDGELSQQLYFDGPSLIGGGEPGFLAMLSATYLW